MPRDHQADEQDLFQPLRPAHGVKFAAAVVIGPVAWIVAWLVAAWLIYETNAIEFGLMVTLASFLFALPVLGLLHHGRRREERRYERDHGGAA